MTRGDRLRLTVERPAAGGRMIARHDGAVVFVSGAIPGEVVDVVVEKVQRGTVWASTVEVLERSADRIDGGADQDCGGSVFAHIAYDRQRQLKSAIIEDAMRRIGRITLDAAVDVTPSPIDGYRMRARLHMRDGRIGFFREGTHNLCAAGPTRQLGDDAIATLTALEQAMAGIPPIVSEIELSENIDATARACHFELIPKSDPAPLVTLTQVTGLVGATAAWGDQPRTMELWGTPLVEDEIAGATLSRQARSFFQANRFLIHQIVDHVLAAAGDGPLLDLYAGVGLFSVTASAAGKGPVMAVEGDTVSSVDLKRNANGRDVTVQVNAVEGYLTGRPGRFASVIVDPPRTGMSKEALTGAIAIRAPRLTYVSCDIATLARDARVLLDAGYRIDSVRAFDMFPNTAHIETVIAFVR